MQIQFWASTDVGRVREHNEDNFLVDKRLRLFVVCDGMGGHAAGEVASALSVRTVRDVISANRDVIERLDADPDDVQARRGVLDLLERAIHDANSRIYEAGVEDESKRGMGTTCSVLLLSQYRGFIGHVGDSRVYLLRNNNVHQMTEDHSLYNEMVRLGKIKPGEQVNLPNKNAVTRAVGVREFVDVDCTEFETVPGDRFLLCSDGLCGYFTSDGQIAQMMRGDQLKDVTERCIRFAVDSGGKDNITAIMVDVEPPQEEVVQHHEQFDSAVEVLKSMPYFEYFNQKELQRVLNLTQRIDLEANDLIYDLDEVAQGLFIVLGGRIEIEGPGGELISELQMGDHFGELGFIDARPAEELAVAIETSVVLELPRKRLMELLRGEPELAVKLLWNFLQNFTGRLREVPASLPLFPEPASQGLQLGEPVSEGLTPPSGNRLPIQTSAMAPASTPEEEPLAPTWGHEETRKVIINADGDHGSGLAETTDSAFEDDEDLRATAEFSREDIENLPPLRSEAPRKDSTQELDRDDIQVMAGVINPKKITTSAKPASKPSAKPPAKAPQGGPPSGPPGAPPPLPPTNRAAAPRAGAPGKGIAGEASTKPAPAGGGISGSSSTTSTSGSSSTGKPATPRSTGATSSPGTRRTSPATGAGKSGSKPGARPQGTQRPAVSPRTKPSTGPQKAISGTGSSATTGASGTKSTRTPPPRAGNSTPPGKASPPAKGSTAGIVRRTSRDNNRSEQRTSPVGARAASNGRTPPPRGATNSSGASSESGGGPRDENTTTVQLDVDDIRRHTSGDSSGSSKEEKEL